MARGRYDLLWVYKEALPWIPRWLERLAFPPGAPYVVDLDDAEFHHYDAHPCRAVRALLSRKIDGVMRDALMVVAGNSYIAARAERVGAARVEILPTVIDLARYPLAPPPVNAALTIGWIGTPITAQFLHWLQPALAEISRRGPTRLLAIGAGPLKLDGVPVEVRPWSEETEVRDMQDCDVGIMPLPDTSFARGKCGLKLIQYMGCARPVVGSPLGVNREIIQHGGNGFHAETMADWVEAMETLRRDPGLRRRMGQAGREHVRERYSLTVAAPKFAWLLRKAAGTVSSGNSKNEHAGTLSVGPHCDGPADVQVRGRAAAFHGGGAGLKSMRSPPPATDGTPLKSAIRSRRTKSPCRDGSPRFGTWLRCARLYRLLRAIRPHVVHSHTPKGGLLGMLAARLAGVPVRVYTIHGLPLMTACGWKRLLLLWTERTACWCAFGVLSVSFSIRMAAVRKRICPAAKIKVLLGGSSNGVNAQREFSPARNGTASRQAIRRQHGIPQDALVISFVGRIVRDKGMVELAEAWRTLRNQFPSLHLLLIGPFEPQDPVPAEVERSFRSDPRIHLIGHVDDVSPYYAATDVLVLPTYREGLPGVLLEAAAMELPVVATRVPGCVDAVVDGVTGALVPSRNAKALAAAVAAYLVDSELRRKHGMAGRQRVLKEFRQEAVWQALYEEYVRLLQEKGLLPPVRPAETSCLHDAQERRAA